MNAHADILPYVESRLNHLVPDGAKPQILIAPEGQGQSKRLGQYDSFPVKIFDGRPKAAELTLDKQGFALATVPTAVKDFYNDEEVTQVYYPEMEALLKRTTGAHRVHVFDHTVRKGRPGDSNENGKRLPVRNVHNDYTPKSGPQRVRDLIGGEEAEALLRHRFAIINVWRPIRGPVETLPLAVADAESLGADDFVAADLVFQDRTGEIFDVAHNPAHRWYYFPKMQRDEVLFLKCYDSALDGRARFSAHSAFEDPTSPADAPPRESIEIRTLVFFPD